MEHLALMQALRDASVVRAEVFERRGKQVIILVVDDRSSSVRPRLSPQDVALLLADAQKKTPGSARIEVALKPRRPRVKRKGRGLPTPVENERAWREKEKQITKFSGKKAKLFNRKIGNKK